MPDISKIKFPSGNIYDIKDAVARQAIANGVTYIVAWKGDAAPDISKIPAGVVVTYDGTDYTGTLAASATTRGKFYLVKSATQVGASDVYDEYVVVTEGTDESPTYSWEKLGDTHVDLASLGDLAYLDTVTLNKGTGAEALTVSTTFTNSSSAVTFSGGTTDKCLGSDATFTTDVVPTTTNIKATASGTALSTSNDTFVKSYPGATSKLNTTSIPNVTGNTDVTIPNVTGNTSVTANKSNWVFEMGTGAESETMIISGGNGADVTATNTTLGTALTASKVTLGTAITAATGLLSSNGGGDSVMTGLGTASTGTALISASVGTQPTVALSTGATAGTGVISVATGITSASTSTNNKDEVTAVTGVGTATAGAQVVTVGTSGDGQKVRVAKYDDLSVTVS